MLKVLSVRRESDEKWLIGGGAGEEGWIGSDFKGSSDGFLSAAGKNGVNYVRISDPDNVYISM